MVFPGQNPSLPIRPFPFDLSAHALPAWVPDCHLDRTVIPCLPSYDSLGVFHCRTIRLLASFATMVSRSNNSSGLATTNRLFVLFPRMITQGRLHCTQQRDSAHCFAGSYLSRTRKQLPPWSSRHSSHNIQVSTEAGSYAPCHWSAPGILNPQHPP